MRTIINSHKIILHWYWRADDLRKGTEICALKPTMVSFALSFVWRSIKHSAHARRRKTCTKMTNDDRYIQHFIFLHDNSFLYYYCNSLFQFPFRSCSVWRVDCMNHLKKIITNALRPLNQLRCESVDVRKAHGGLIIGWFLTDTLSTSPPKDWLGLEFSNFSQVLTSWTNFRNACFIIQCDLKRNEYDVRGLVPEQQHHQTHNANFSSCWGVYWLHLIARCLLMLLLPHSTRKWRVICITWLWSNCQTSLHCLMYRNLTSGFAKSCMRATTTS